MKVAKPSWGEVRVLRKGIGKKFDASKSFSIDQTSTNYTIEEYHDLLQIITDITEKLAYSKLKEKLAKL